MKLNQFENKRIFRDRNGVSRTVVRDTYVNQTTNVPPKVEEKKEEPKPTSKKKQTYKKTSKTDETKGILPKPSRKQSPRSSSSDR
tara:strand:- start:1393 stop:1647 length:255 start_codon:yes stop_codon:yes gene_type:complete